MIIVNFMLGAMALTAIAFVLLSKRLKVKAHWYFWVGAALVVFLVVPTLTVLTFTWMRIPSRVDVSPIAQLTAEQVAGVEDAIARLVDHDSITVYSIRERLPGDPGIYPPYLRLYLFRYHSQSRGADPWLGMVSIQVLVYPCDLTADTGMFRWRERNIRRIDNDNNTRATLQPARSAINQHIRNPSLERVQAALENDYLSRAYFRSAIRIGNVAINFRETGQLGRLSDNATGEFIVLLVEMLQE